MGRRIGEQKISSIISTPQRVPIIVLITASSTQVSCTVGAAVVGAAVGDTVGAAVGDTLVGVTLGAGESALSSPRTKVLWKNMPRSMSANAGTLLRFMMVSVFQFAGT